MKHRDLFWALAAVGGIVYLATRAAESKLPAVQPNERPEPAVNPVALSLPMTQEAAPVQTFPVNEPTVSDQRTAVYRTDLRNAIDALEGRTESGRFLEIDGPQTF